LHRAEAALSTVARAIGQAYRQPSLVEDRYHIAIDGLHPKVENRPYEQAIRQAQAKDRGGN